MKHLKILTLVLIAAIVTNCKKDDTKDQTKPVIDMSFAGASPMNCDTVRYGNDLILKVKFSDNAELGSFSVSIHDNFDGHSHSTEALECNNHAHEEDEHHMAEDHEQEEGHEHDESGFRFVHDYVIPTGLTEYETTVVIPIPAANEHNEMFEEGSYHFFISLTDKQGWSTEKGLSLTFVY